MTLYEMQGVALQLYQMLNADEIDEATVTDTLQSIGVEDKLEAYCQVINQLNGEADMLAAEKKRIDARLKQTNNGIERLKSALNDYFAATGKTKEKAGAFTLTRVKSGIPKLIINDKEAIDKSYWYIPDPELNEKAVKEALVNGEEIDGAELSYTYSMRIK